MKCPFCGHGDTQVAETRESDAGDAIRRRRRCLGCDRRFTTYERPEVLLPTVVKKDGSRADFDRDKLRRSMLLALRKRDVKIELVNQALARILERLSTGSQNEVASSQLGELVLDELKAIDTVAYIRFASVYRRFDDAAAFRRLIGEI